MLYRITIAAAFWLASRNKRTDLIELNSQKIVGFAQTKEMCQSMIPVCNFGIANILQATHL